MEKFEEELALFNLTGLILVQNIAKSNKAEAMFRFGLNEAALNLLLEMKVPQLQKLSQLPFSMFNLKMSHEMIWDILGRENMEGKEILHAIIARGSNE